MKNLLIIFVALLSLASHGYAENLLDKPGKTWTVGKSGKVDFTLLSNAKSQARAGDTIYVFPGHYTNTANLLKGGVNWNFAAGAVVHQVATSPSQVMFGDGFLNVGTAGTTLYGAVTSTICGRGEFLLETVAGTAEGDSPWGVFEIFNAASVVHVQAKTIAIRGSATLDDWAVAVSDCKHVRIEADEITSGGDGSAGDLGGGAVYWLNGDMEVNAGRIISEAGIAVYGEQDAGKRGYSNLYVNADVIGGTNNSAVWCYNNAATNTMWIKANEIYTGDSQTIHNSGIKLYVEAQKISNTAVTTNAVLWFDGGPSASQVFWLSAQKISSPGRFIYSSANAVVSTNFIHVQHFEGLAGITNGIEHVKGKTIITGQAARLPATTAGTSFVNHSGGTLTLQGMTIDSPVSALVQGAGLSVKGCSLIATAAASITAPSVQTVGVYWSAANVTTNGNITFTPNAGWTVNAAVK